MNVRDSLRLGSFSTEEMLHKGEKRKFLAGEK